MFYTTEKPRFISEKRSLFSNQYFLTKCGRACGGGMGNLNEGASKQLRKRLSELECDIVRLICEDSAFLSSDEAASLRWAMSLARISKVRVDKNRPANDVIIEHASDRYRAELYALLSCALNSFDLLDKEKLKDLIP